MAGVSVILLIQLMDCEEGHARSAVLALDLGWVARQPWVQFGQIPGLLPELQDGFPCQRFRLPQSANETV